MPHYSPDGLWELDEASNAWVPRKVVAPPAPPPPPPPAAPGPPPLPGMTPFTPSPFTPGPPPPSIRPHMTQSMPGAINDEWDLTAEAGNRAGVPIGAGLVVIVNDVELSLKDNKDPRLVVQGALVQPNGNTAAGTKAIWGYTLSQAAIWKLGSDLVALGITRISKDPKTAEYQLTEYLRGKLLLLDSEPGKDAKYNEVSVKGFYSPSGAPAGSVVAPPPAPVPGYGVSFQPPPGTGFKAV